MSKLINKRLLTNYNKDCIMSSLTKTNSILYLHNAAFGKQIS